MKSLRELARNSIGHIFTLVSGGLIGFGVPYWQANYLNQSNLDVEVIKIEKSVPVSERINPEDYKLFERLNQLEEELDKLDSNNSYSSFSLGFSTSISRYLAKSDITSIDDIFDDIFDDEKERKERIVILKERSSDDLVKLQQYLSDLSSLSIEDFSSLSRIELRKYSQVVFRDIDSKVWNDNSHNPQKNNKYFKSIKKNITDSIESQIEYEQERNVKINEFLDLWEKEFEPFIQQLKGQLTRISINALVTNTGKSSIALKEQALFRLYVGDNNYFDIKLNLDDKKSKIDPSSSLYVNYYSITLSEMDDESKNMINAYWGKNILGKIFVIDVKGDIYESFDAPFSNIFYQKSVYDALRDFASSQK
ncbi:TPA: hypothetical protein NGR42_004760 [Vibrio parahaemolyticus]|nr:hypothetical protein [Vibrio parahaemolyticus]HCE4480254.1 hypothetical protein [Vibrio parahaemolyticus]